MINGGEGTPRGKDASSGRITSPNLFHAAGSKSDGEDVSPSSRYSSCGESEFERYCSANSAMGTPSLSSSVPYTDCLDSDFGSFRSLGFGDDSSLDNFSLGGRLERNSDRNLRVRFSQESTNCDELSSSNEIEGSAGYLDSEPGTVHGGDLVGKLESGNLRERTLVGAGNASISESGNVSSDDYMHLGGKDNRHSDEDSMYNYGSDDDSSKNLPYLRNIQHDTGGRDDGNPFLMNSSVAFGSEDWNDYVQEAREIVADPLALYPSLERKEVDNGSRRHLTDFSSESQIDISTGRKTREGKDMKDLSLIGDQILDHHGQLKRKAFSNAPSGSRTSAEGAGEGPREGVGWGINKETSSTAPVSVWKSHEHYGEDGLNNSQTSDPVRIADESEEYLNSCPITNVFEMVRDPIVEKAQLEVEVPGVMETNVEVDHPRMVSENLNSIDFSQEVEDMELEDMDKVLDPLIEPNTNQLSYSPIVPPKIKTDVSDDKIQTSLQLMTTNDPARHSIPFHLSTDIYEEHDSPTKVENVELSEFLDDVLHDMEEILLDTVDSPGARFSHGKRTLLTESTLSQRDGGLTASTSAADDLDTFIQHTKRIDGVEVTGAKQKKGDVSLSERLLGVKEYTVYVIRVWSGNHHWEVERRYRDFLTLHRRLKSFFSEHGWSLPPEWSSIDRESRKLFGGASPDVISERSALIQDCLRSVIHSRFFSRPPNALQWFLSPQDSGSMPSSPLPNNRLARQFTSISEASEAENISSFGKTIPLIVEIHPYKSMKQLLEGQHYCCAGCRRHFDEGRTLVRDFVQTLGWGKPRLCEYMGQLFCSSCHTNETAVLPARVLHYWDFTEYSVCQLAKSYLDSIHDKPVLCVSAVNPFLFAKVPGLLHVMGIRKKIGAMLPFVRCPFRRSINQGLGFRRYLLESNDFFALRDLIDLSRGAFAALPAMLETVSRKILEHITEQCLICCDVGIPCSAKQDCRDPSSLIFPFQEDEIERCTFCKLVFHKPCFKRLGKCPCQTHDDGLQDHSKIDSSSETLDLQRRNSGSFFSSGLLSTLFPKVNSGRAIDHKEDDTIILMGSLPSTSL